MMNIKLKSLKSINLKKEQLNQIFKLKNSYWVTSLSKQKKWFRENINPSDIHNVIFKDRKIIGYNCLRSMKLLNNKNKYLLFDTIIIKNTYRKLNLGSLLMKQNNKIIKKKGIAAILLCDQKKIKFYKKNRWRLINKKFYKKSRIKKNLMSFNDPGSFFNKRRLNLFCSRF